ncbi:hypothetical protein ACFLZ9_02195 [Patescibacteria group bacterium]
MKELWLDYIATKWGMMQKFTLLAIDIPRNNVQSPKAVENLFTYIASTQKNLDLLEKYWIGMYQLSFSFEIVSIEGYTQFLIRTPIQFINVVESAVYSQYPDAEITEVDDYVHDGLPTKFPDDEYDLWGAEFVQANAPCYPIKTYIDFEHQFGKDPEAFFKDPMASLMDLYSSIGKGEQLWFQLLITPIGFEGEVWSDIGDKEISKILGESTKPKSGLVDFFIEMMLSVLSFFGEIFSVISPGTEAKDDKKEEDSFRMFNLKPKEKNQMEAIQYKLAKLGFDFKTRFIYLAKKEVMNKPKALGFVGYMKQFVNMDLNNLKPDMKKTATSAHYFFTNYRLNLKKTKIMRAYKWRSTLIGRKKGKMNIEELATLWHFPIEAVVKAPLIQKAPGRKAKPPMSLPLEEERARVEIDEIFNIEKDEENIFETEKDDKNITPEVESYQHTFDKPNNLTNKKSSPPANLPIA